MPIRIIRQDITKVKCDAIINAANNTLLGGGGVDGAIHLAAGEQLLEECKTLNGCKTGYAKITKGYNLPCKYVIHTVGPIWRGGKNGEQELLKSCYEKSLALAKEYNCETVAFPLISSGAYGYPKDKALSVAINTITSFLLNNEMLVYIVVYDKRSFKISDKLFYNVSTFIDDNYVENNIRRGWDNKRVFLREVAHYEVCYEDDFAPSPRLKPNLIEMLSSLDDTFAVTLLRLIDAKKMTDVECYKKANVSKQTWYKILNEKNYRPSKNTIIAFAISLQLTLEETQKLLATVGFTLSKSSKFDIIIEYFLLNEEYNIFTINETLFKFDQPCLGV